LSRHHTGVHCWRHSGFHTGWQERKIDAGDRKNLEGLLTYMERPAVSLRRLRYRDDGMVHYQGTRFNPRLRLDHQLLTPIEFLALLVPHVALKYEITIRLYGALSTTFRRKVGWIRNPPVHEPPPEPIPLPVDAAAISSQNVPAPPPPILPAGRHFASSAPPHEEDSPFLRKRRRSWAQLIYKAWLEDPSLCRSCGQPMKIIAAIAREQGDAIERILRSLKLWDPPWKRQRKVRGPPPSSMDGPVPSPTKARKREATFEADSVDPIIDDELYAVDPDPPDDDAPA
jgi:hypothetical protein